MAVSSTQENVTMQENASVDEAKRRLREAAAGFDPSSLVRRRPLTCTGGAFLLGLGWHWGQPRRMASGMMAFALQSMSRVVAGSLAAQLKGAFSSGASSADDGNPGTDGVEAGGTAAPPDTDASASRV